MRYRYPKISNALIYKKLDAETVEVTDFLTQNVFSFPIETARFVKRLDGHTDPYKISTELDAATIDEILKALEEYELLQKSGAIKYSAGTRLLRLWVPKRSALLTMWARLSNFLLTVLWLPVFALGILMYIRNITAMETGYLLLGFAVGFLFGIVFHELGHAFAGMSYGARVFEMGVMVMYGILPGAYVLMDESPVKKRMQRVQINAAGVESNLLLSGVFLLLCVAFPPISGVLLSAAVFNTVLGVVNLVFIKGLDGCSLVSELLGIDNAISFSNKIVFNKKARKKLTQRGVNGYAVVAVCYMLCAIQITLPVLIVSNILEVILYFV